MIARFSSSCILVAVVVICIGRQSDRVNAGPSNLAVLQPVRGAETAESAATAMVRAYADKDFELFMQTRALFECEDMDRGGPNRYAESLHLTKFTSRDHAHTVYSLPTRLNAETTRTIVTHRPKLEFADAAMFSDKVPQHRHVFVDVAIEDHQKVRYQSRVVVIELSNKWYAVPRCYSSRRVYELADATSPTAPAIAK